MVRNDMPDFRVVVNGEGQYSVWPGCRELPRGWEDAGRAGSKEECLGYIEQVWTDMRPRSLRERAPTPATLLVEPPAGPTLVERLCEGERAVELSRVQQASDLREQLGRRYVFMRFAETRGGTELAFTPDPEGCELGELDYERGVGRATLRGTLKLDFEALQLTAEIDLATRRGSARVERLAS